MPRTPSQVAGELYDQPRDLEPHEQEFLTAVHRIGVECAETIGISARATGPDSTVTNAIRFTANRRRDERYATALQRYDAACDALVEA
jgi:hypothetical protein